MLQCNAKFGCRKCRKYFEKAQVSSKYKNKLIEGRLIKEQSKELNTLTVYRHHLKPSHLAVDNFIIRAAKSTLGKQFAQCEKKANEKLNNKYAITGDMMKVVYFELKVNIPIYHHRKLITLLESLGVNMGFHHYDTRGAWRIADHITDQMHLELLKFLKADTSPLSLVVDSATDPSQNHFLCVFIQTLHQDKPKVFMYRVPGLGSDETAAGLMQSLEDVFEEDGITAIIKKRLIAFVADGASVNLGKVDQI